MLGEERREICRNALNHGFLCIFPVVLFSAVFNIVLKLTGLKDAHPLAYEACYTFIVLAFAEELVKYLMFRRVLKKTDLPLSWLDVTALMTIVGIGFALAFLIHGLYDFSLSKEFLEINDNLAFVPLLLAVLDIVMVIMLIVFVRKAAKREEYTAPLESETPWREAQNTLEETQQPSI